MPVSVSDNVSLSSTRWVIQPGAASFTLSSALFARSGSIKDYIKAGVWHAGRMRISEPEGRFNIMTSAPFSAHSFAAKKPVPVLAAPDAISAPGIAWIRCVSPHVQPVMATIFPSSLWKHPLPSQCRSLHAVRASGHLQIRGKLRKKNGLLLGRKHVSHGL